MQLFIASANYCFRNSDPITTENTSLVIYVTASVGEIMY